MEEDTRALDGLCPSNEYVETRYIIRFGNWATFSVMLWLVTMAVQLGERSHRYAFFLTLASLASETLQATHAALAQTRPFTAPLRPLRRLSLQRRSAFHDYGYAKPKLFGVTGYWFTLPE
jgi:hypothetical protein